MAAAIVLSMGAASAATASYTQLQSALGSPDHLVRIRALEAESDSALRDPRILPTLVRIALADSDDYVRLLATDRVGAMRAPERDRGIADFRQALRDPLPERRRHAIGSLARVAPSMPGAVDTIATTLRDTSEEVRRAAAYALQEMRPASATSVAALLAAAKLPADGETLLAIQGALRSSGGPAVAALEPLAREPDPAQRRFVLMALPDAPNAAPIVLGALRDPDEVVRGMAVLRLSLIEPRTPEIAAALRVATRDTSEEIGGLARLAAASDPDSARILSHTETGRPVMNRDTTAFAVGLTAEHYREATPLDFARPFGGPHRVVARYFDVLAYDLARRTGPVRVARWPLGEEARMRLIGWDAEGIIVLHDSTAAGDIVRAERVDPATGARNDLGPVTERTMDRRWAQLNDLGSGWDERHKTHVEERSEGFFLWRMQTREREFLFRRPRSHDGCPDPDSSGMEISAEYDRIADKVQRVWEATTRQDADSARFVIETYVPRPGKEARAYSAEVRVEVPDTTQEAQHVFATNMVPLVTRQFVLGPTRTTFVLAVPTRDLRQVLAPYRRSRQLWGATWDTAAWITLRPLPLPGDEGRMPPGILDGSADLGYTGVRLPVR